jgi:hypothetical protein
VPTVTYLYGITLEKMEPIFAARLQYEGKFFEFTNNRYTSSAEK